uniref:Uncharacterized protein n=1 Tax=Caenorhabditis japonica TaxID=281687 RepID=A0A8R1EBS3_CAEJA
MLVLRARNRYLRLGTPDDRPRSGRPVTVTTPRAVKAVGTRIQSNPERSMRKMSLDFGMCPKSKRTIVGNKFKMIPYQAGVLPWAHSYFGNLDGPTGRRSCASCKGHSAMVQGPFWPASWPASSPDLNPMDYAVWGYLTEKGCTRNYANINSLNATLVEAWDQMSDQDEGRSFRKLLLSLISVSY